MKKLSSLNEEEHVDIKKQRAQALRSRLMARVEEWTCTCVVFLVVLPMMMGTRAAQALTSPRDWQRRGGWHEHVAEEGGVTWLCMGMCCWLC